MLDFLTNLFFESLPLLAFFCVVAIAVAVAVHRRRLTPGSQRGLWLTLAICAALLVLQWLVQTDREQLDAAVRAMARGVQAGDVGAVAEQVGDSFDWDGGRQGFIDSMNRTLQTYDINEARIFGVKAQVEGDAATVTFGAMCDVQSPSRSEYNLLSRWKLRFTRQDGRWRLQRIESAKLGPGDPSGGGGIDAIPYIR